MKKKIIGIIVCTLMIASSISVLGIEVEEKTLSQINAPTAQTMNDPLIPKSMDLTLWRPEYFDFGPENLPEVKGEWEIMNCKTHALQKENCDACFLLHPTFKNKWDVACKFIVSPAGDDDWIGFTFGYRDKSHFYIFDWASDWHDHENIPGFSIKEVTNVTPDNLNETDFKTTIDTDSTKILDSQYGHQNAWYKDIWYDFYLQFNKGTFTVTVKNGSTILYTKKISGGKYTSGTFGFYAESQANVMFGAFIDQQQQNTDDLQWLEPLPSSNWQQFKNKGKTLETVELHIGNYFSTPFDITCSIEETLGNSLSQVTYLTTDLPNNKQDWFLFDIPDVQLKKDAVYYINITINSDGEGIEIAWSGSYDNPYPYGRSSNTDPNWDFAFITIVTKSKQKVVNTPFLHLLENYQNLFLIIQRLLQFRLY